MNTRLLLLRYAKMETLQELALQAVSFPGKQAEMFLPAHHPIAKKRQALDYQQMMDKFRQEHQVKLRYVLPYIRKYRAFGKSLTLKKFVFLD